MNRICRIAGLAVIVTMALSIVLPRFDARAGPQQRATTQYGVGRR